MRTEWAILEDTFPQSINTYTDWLRLRRGECTNIDNVSWERDGVLQFAGKPKPSAPFIAREFVDPDGDAPVTPDQAKRVWAYGRWWRVSRDYPYRLEYTGFGQETNDTFVVSGYDDFNEDAVLNEDKELNRISMIVPFDGGSWVILKPKAGYVLTNANGDAAAFRRAPAYYGIGCSNPGSWYSNCVIGGNVATAWDGGGQHGIRHYLWNTRDGAEELSRTVRDLSANVGEDERCKIDWSQNLVIAGGLVYDLIARKVYKYSDASGASFTSRPYYEVFFKPTMWKSLGFICTGDEGSFNVTFEYGQAEDSLSESITKKININSRNKREFFHEWVFEDTITTRVARIKIDTLVGAGITQICALSSLVDSIRSMDYLS